MKRISLATLLACACLIAYSQKTDIEKPKITYIQLPLKPLPKGVKKYDIKITNPKRLRLPTEQQLAENQLKIQGLEYSATDPDVILLVMVNGLSTGTTTFAKATTNTGQQAQFYYRGTAQIYARVSFLTPDFRQEYYARPFNDEISSSIESPTMFATDELAKQALANDKTLIERVTAACIDQAFFTLNTYLNKNHGTTTQSEYLPIWTIKSKSHDYADFDKAKDTYLAAMQQYASPALKEESKKKIQECVDVWAKAAAEYNPKDKDAKINSKNILEIYMNLAIGNVWTENFDEAKKWFALAVEEKGLNGWKPVVNELINNGAQAFETNALREKDMLKIEMAESPFAKGINFGVSSADYRVKYMEYYDEYNPKKLKYRKVFEYDDYGMVTQVYTQDYNDVSKIWGDAKDRINVNYNLAEKVMVITKDKTPKPLVINTMVDGRLVKQETNKDQSHVYEFSYNDKGDLQYYRRTTGSGGKKVWFSYQDGMVTSVTTKLWFMNMKDSVFNNLKFNFVNDGRKKSTYDMFASNSGDLKAFGEKRYSAAYTYDEKGNITKVASPGQNFNYKYDLNGNLVETIITSDTTPTHYTYVWEEGSGNASMFLRDFENQYLDPLFYPQLR